LCVNGDFQKYDYGKEKNLSVYGVELPPKYDLSQIHHFPIALFCGREDLLASTEDYTWLSKELEKTDSLLAFKEFDIGHLGFLLPTDATLFIEMLELMHEKNPR
jgi:hypothetical protein